MHFLSTISTFPYPKIGAIRVMKHDCAYARFRIHHEALGQLDANLFRAQQFPERRLILQVRASRISKAVTLSAVSRSKPLRHCQVRSIWESPVFADSPVQPFGARFRAFNRQGLQSV